MKRLHDRHARGLQLDVDVQQLFRDVEDEEAWIRWRS